VRPCSRPSPALNGLLSNSGTPSCDSHEVTLLFLEHHSYEECDASKCAMAARACLQRC
jgi:hypothetical protein